MQNDAQAKALRQFTEYFVRNYPGPNTVIFDPKWHAPKIFNAAYAALSALVEDRPVADSEWHRSNNAMGGVLLYTLREDGRRRGEPLMVNDLTVRIERAAGSEADIEPVVQRIRSALAPAPAGEDAWQPIDTAPKDGTVIDVWLSHPDHDGGYRWSNAIWRNEEWRELKGAAIEALFDPQTGVPLIRVTHWRPLPAPPALSRKGSDTQTVGGGMATEASATEARVRVKLTEREEGLLGEVHRTNDNPNGFRSHVLSGGGTKGSNFHRIALEKRAASLVKKGLLATTPHGFEITQAGRDYLTPSPETSATTHRDPLPSDAAIWGMVPAA